MPITGPQARAARALVQWPRDHVARLAGLDLTVVAEFEAGRLDPGGEAKRRLATALESGGAVFIDENGGGLGVRLKFRLGEARSINRLENEGGPVGDDDVA